MKLKDILIEHPQYGANAPSVPFARGITPRYIRITDITDDGDLSDSDLVGIDRIESQGSEVKDGDLLIARTGNTVGKSLIYRNKMGECAFAGYLIRFRVAEEKYNLDLLGHYLRSLEFKKWVANTLKPGAQPNINSKQYLELELPNIRLDRQQNFADMLNTWSQAIKIESDKLSLLNRKYEAQLVELLLECKHTKKILTLGECSELINGRAYKITEWEESGTPVIRLQNLTGTGDQFYFSNLNLPNEKYCENGDILFMWSATFGPHIWRGDRAIFHYHIWKVLPKETEIQKSYLYYLLEANTAVWKKKTVGSTMAHLTKERMEKVQVKLPSLEYQKTVADYLETLSEEISVLKTKIEKLRFQKFGLMQRIFAGEM